MKNIIHILIFMPIGIVLVLIGLAVTSTVTPIGRMLTAKGGAMMAGVPTVFSKRSNAHLYHAEDDDDYYC